MKEQLTLKVKDDKDKENLGQAAQGVKTSSDGQAKEMKGGDQKILDS